MVMNERVSLAELITDFHHDFRSVLSNLVGYVDHLLEGAGGSLTDIQEESLGIILKNAHRLKLMADNLARAAQEDTIHLVTSDVFDLRKTIERSLRLYSLSARDSGVDLRSTWEAASFLIQGSELLTGSLFDNLLSNAIKFTPPGGKVSVHGMSVGKAVTILVEDTGAGIPPEDLPRLFERGFRGTVAGGGRREGLGLGLSICKGIAEAHNARIEVFSRIGEGTKIEVTFPAAPF
jgi:signal transduction histidine kinase